MKKYILLTPLALGKTTVTELSLRTQTIAEDYLCFDNYGGVAQTQAIIASMASIEPAMVKRLSGADYLRLKQHVESCLQTDEKLLGEAESTGTVDEKKPNELPELQPPAP